MKKLILSAAILSFAGFSTIGAYAHNPTITINYSIQDTKTPVKLEELPEAVKNVLSGEEFKEWTPTEAFLVKTDKGVEYYQINVKNGDKSGSLNVDKDGKSIQDEAKAEETKTEAAPDATTPPASTPEATTPPTSTPEATNPSTEATPDATNPSTEAAPEATNTSTEATPDATSK
ncbi:MAG: hypothetical protein ACOH2A_00315 [Sphingobacteriaceae bacterium]